MTATYYPVEGQPQEVKPANGSTFTYAELQKFIGGSGMIEIVPLPSGKVIVVDEEGKLVDEEFWAINQEATKIWNTEYPIEMYPNNNDQTIVGNALVCESAMIE